MHTQDPTVPTGGGGDGGSRRFRPGRLIAGRYRLGPSLGGGAHGEVFAADDEVTGERVAVKRFRGGHDATRVRREIGALRILRLPGVVRLLDEGVDASSQFPVPFLVMERIDGTPFPGRATPSGWPDIAATVLALLETLGQVHAAGIVHRDLKPANVLVDASGRPTVVDFGVSAAASFGAGLTQEGQILGTPAYLAPEQIRGEPVGPHTDLYALGVMVYEALTGRLPHRSDELRSLFYERLHRRPEPLARVVPGVPPAVAAVMDALLAPEPDDRPRSADRVIARLSGDVGQGTAQLLPRLGGDGALRSVLDTVAAGRSIDLRGPRGAGRSRLLTEATAVWTAAGRTVLTLQAGTAAYDSLEPALGALSDMSDRSLAEVDAEVDRRLQQAFAAGAVIVADDAERLDSRSARALERWRGEAPVLRAYAAARPTGAAGELFLADLEEPALRALFAGPDRLFHRREDAARAIWERTRGRPARVADEVVRWIRAGVAHWRSDELVVEPGRLEDLVTRPLSLGYGAVGDIPLPPALADLVAWLALTGPVATAPRQPSVSDPGQPTELPDSRPAATATADLAAPDPDATPAAIPLGILVQVTGSPRFRVEAMLEELEQRGILHRAADDSVAVDHTVEVITWPPRQIRAAHRALAATLAPGSPRRLLHLLAGEEPDQPLQSSPIVDEALALARRAARDGKLARAVVRLADGLTAVRRSSAVHTADELAILSLWVEVALMEGTTRSLDRVLDEIGRSAARGAATAALESLVRSALAALTVGGDRALSLVDAVPPFATVALERERHGARVIAARRCGLDRERAVVDEAARWVEAEGDAEAQARLAGWQGRLRYREGGFDEAAALHRRAGDATDFVTVRIAAWLNAASALMEAFDHAAATQDALRARDLAARHRCVFLEGRAEWILRSIGYRDRVLATADTELVAAVEQVGVLELEAQVCFTEAAIGFRAGERARARALSGRASSIWSTLGMRWPAAVARALAVASGEPVSDADWEALVGEAPQAWDPGLGLQALALACWSGDRCLPPPLREAARALAARVPASHWDERMDVLSVREALDRIGT